MKRLVTLFLVFLFAGPLFAQVEEQIDVGVLEIWVKVTDKQGKAVSDLKSEDFKLFIDGQPGELKCFDKSFQESDSGSGAVLIRDANSCSFSTC